MKILSFDVGVSTGYAALDSTSFERLCGGTIIIGENAPDSTYLTIHNIIEDIKPDVIVVEYPVDDPNNPIRAVLKAVSALYTEVISATTKEFNLNTRVVQVRPATWKTSPSKKYIAPYWSKSPIKPSKHEMDATRIAHWYIKFADKNKNL